MEYHNQGDQCILETQEINIKDVIDFCWCPKYYELKNRNPNEKNLKELYDISLHKCFYSYLYAIQNDTLEEGIKTLKYKWSQLFDKDEIDKEVVEQTVKELEKETEIIQENAQE